LLRLAGGLLLGLFDLRFAKTLVVTAAAAAQEGHRNN